MSNENIIPDRVSIVKPKRTRINNNIKPVSAKPAIEDERTFKKNKCTHSALEISQTSESIDINLWGDQHYFLRHIVGDKDGQRQGIDPDSVEKLVRNSIKYLFLFSAAVKGFKFINFEGAADSKLRVVLQKDVNGIMLNVTVETHYIEVNNYEITVNTAMSINGFRIQDGQFSIELQDECAILRRCENKILKEICTF